MLTAILIAQKTVPTHVMITVYIVALKFVEVVQIFAILVWACVLVYVLLNVRMDVVVVVIIVAGGVIQDVISSVLEIALICVLIHVQALAPLIYILIHLLQ